MVGKHTPGPWVITSHRPPYSEGNDFPGVGISIPSEELTSGIHEDAIEVWGENSEANARLIAAAPDLLQSCRGMLHALETDYRDTGKWDELMGEAVAAIAKATGATP